VAARNDTAKHGGWEQQMPPQAAVIPLGLPCLSYDPTIQAGVGQIRVFAPSERFM
jgi:hypothetical protein